MCQREHTDPSPAHDRFECECKENARATIDMLMLMQTAQARKWNKLEHGYTKLPKQWKSN